MADYCCGNCERLEKNGRVYYGNEYYCSKDGKTHKLTSRACSAIIKDKSIRDKESNEWHKSGWKFYIVTVVSKIIKSIYGSDLDMLPYLSKIRSEYLEPNPEYQSVIDDYDYFGPMIADIIDNSPDREYIAIELSNSYLIPALREVLDDNYEEATRIFVDMVTMLKVEYNLISVAPEVDLVNRLNCYELNLERIKSTND